MLKLFFLIGFLSTAFAFECEKLNLEKVGCFKRNEKVFSKLLVTYRDPSHEAFGQYINWRNFGTSLQSLACDCAAKAKKEGYVGIALGFYGECHATKDRASLEELKISKSSLSKFCINHKYGKCEASDKKCVGQVSAEYVYNFPSSAPEIPEEINGGYTEWSEFTPCSATCGEGIQSRERACTNPSPKNGGADCKELGDTTETKTCKVKECPVNGEYGEWTNYGSCSKSCGSGLKSKTRACDSPAPAHGGLPCEGPASESVACNTQPCLGGGKCVTKVTNFDTYNGGEAIYLDRHSLQCPEGSLLNYMKLERSADQHSIRYKYKCCESQLQCTNSRTVNDPTYHGGENGKTYYLDRQTIQCKKDGISFLHLNRENAQWNYRYDCCNVDYKPSSVTCKDKDTGFNDDGNGENIYFDRHTLSCDTDNEFMTYIKLVRNDSGGKIRFNYKCCHLNDPKVINP